ncbi:LytR/AlgR family response regulator transcription factor [Peptostreptococcus faecalis]|uniref:LytR/AlgR family response regulator transcription factor n=1 Tax=Peptostreptococcus faecalis TaxID=2045015 RepID=UPI000C7C44E5|nr:LytTR family DNA-binding domain-containing protein [Peptostreptococcus faecalis]
MINIGICDDSQEARFLLSVTLERILDKKNIKYNIYEFSSGERFLKWFNKYENRLDLLFLDIEMLGIDGMDTAKRIREFNSLVQIVFVTSHPTYVFDGYSVGALGYIMKPAKETQVEDALERAIFALNKNKIDVYVIKNIDGIYKIPKHAILFFYSEKRTIVCVTKDNNYTFYAKLDNVEEEVSMPFVRIHQRYLVNADLVDRINIDSVSIGGEELPISRSYKEKAVLELSRSLLK